MFPPPVANADDDMQKAVWSPPVDRGIRGFASWQAFVDESFPWLDVSHGHSDFKASARLRTFGDGSLAAMTTDACRVTRDALCVRRADAGHLKVLWQRAGTMGVEQDGRACLLRAGDAAICDTGRPYRLTLSNDTRLVVLTLPYRAVIGWERLSEHVCGASLDDRAVSDAALAASLVLLGNGGPTVDDGPARVLYGVQSMLSASLHRRGDRRMSPAPLKMAGVHEHVLAHIDDPDLNPDDLAAALRISRRRLYELFEGQATTPSRFIRDVRLERVGTALIDAKNARKSILEIALDHGFSASASFCRTFKAAYGVSPRAWREQAKRSSDA